MARVCMLEIYNGQKFGPDSIIKEAEEILAMHPTNRRALALAADRPEVLRELTAAWNQLNSQMVPPLWGPQRAGKKKG